MLIVPPAPLFFGSARIWKMNTRTTYRYDGMVERWNLTSKVCMHGVSALVFTKSLSGCEQEEAMNVYYHCSAFMFFFFFLIPHL